LYSSLSENLTFSVSLFEIPISLIYHDQQLKRPQNDSHKRLPKVEKEERKFLTVGEEISSKWN